MPFKHIQSAPEGYSDYSSLKQWLERRYGSNKINLHQTILSQTGTAGAVEWENKGGETIAQIGKTELTIVAACDTNDNAYDTKTITIHYLDADGVSHSAVATYDPDNTTTEVAFVPAVSDFYCWDPAYGVLAVVSSVAVQAGDNVYIGTTGMVADATKRYATILAAATSPTAANLLGVGTIYGTEAANQDDAGYIATLQYVTPWGEIKEGTWTFAADSSVATRFASTTDSGLYVNDFYRLRDFSLDHAALDECRISNADKSAIYGVIDDTLDHSIFSRYICPYGYRAWIAKLCGTVSTNTYIQFAMTFTPKDHSIAQTTTLRLPQDAPFNIEPLFELEPITEAYFTILGNTAEFCGQMIIIEVEE